MTVIELHNELGDLIGTGQGHREVILESDSGRQGPCQGVLDLVTVRANVWDPDSPLVDQVVVG